MKLTKVAGATSEIWQIFIQDSSSQLGAGLTGLVFNSGSLTAYFHRDTDTTATAITLATMTVGTFTSSGFKEIDATNMPGWYQFCPPNTALASGAKSCAIHLKGASNMAPLPIEVQLTTVNPDSAGFGLVNASANVAQWNGTNVASPATAGIPDVNVKNIDNDAASASGTVTFPNATLASTTNITAGTIATVTNLTNAPTIGDLTATMKTSVTTAATAATPTVSTLGANTITATSIAANALTAAKIAADAIGASQLAADAVTEIQTGLATSTQATNIQSDTDNIQTRLPAALTGDGNMKSDILKFTQVVESAGSYTGQQVLSILLAFVAGVTSDNGLTFKSPDGVSTRGAATVDVDNNRTAMSLTPSS